MLREICRSCFRLSATNNSHEKQNSPLTSSRSNQKLQQRIELFLNFLTFSYTRNDRTEFYDDMRNTF